MSALDSGAHSVQASRQHQHPLRFIDSDGLSVCEGGRTAGAGGGRGGGGAVRPRAHPGAAVEGRPLTAEFFRTSCSWSEILPMTVLASSDTTRCRNASDILP